ncbi:MAG: NAD(P)/FAD-dependent oxidoreductase [Clostridia bacterium]|nr:NAD(P)/FAD-dependent oxidoreductase [Clostridia bacterium]
MNVIVIGGGAAGMMAAIMSSRNGNQVTILEKMRSMGRKLSITGKGRCNITNATDMDNFIKNVPGNGKFLFSAFSKFTNQDAINFFNEIGVKTKVERGDRVFPVSDSAMEVIDKLKKELDKQNVKVIVDSPVKCLVVEDGRVTGVKTEAGKTYSCDKVILATGGKSYPTTGSTGDGYKIAKMVGHTIVEPKPSLVPLETYEKKIEKLQGLSLKNVGIKIFDGTKLVYEDFGEMLFAHYGVTGPIILSGSAHLLRVKNIEEKLKSQTIKIKIDLKPALTTEKLEARIQRDLEKYTKKQYKNSLADLLPGKMIPYIVEESGIDEEKQTDQITKEERKNLAELLKHLEFTIKGFRPIEEAIITAGGISTKEINASTMESKIVNGLYFAGEIIDVDAYTGGFNLQIAYSTAYVAAQ